MKQNRGILFIQMFNFLTKHACDERLCSIVPCIGENW